MKVLDWRDRLRAPWNRADPAAIGGPDLGGVLQRDFFVQAWNRKPVVFDFGARFPVDWPAVVRELAGRLPSDRVEHETASGRVRGAPASLDAAGDGERLLLVRDPHRDVEPVAQLRAAFARMFGCPVSTVLYLNGPGAPGFPVHHDAHHVFALQLAGEKTWFLGPARVAAPHRRYDHPLSGPESALSPVVVGAGKTLYLPPGIRHRAEVTGEVSVHLTMGVHAPRVIDVLEAMVEDLGGHDPALRASVGLGLEGGRVRFGADRQALARQLRRVADRLGSWSPTLADGTVVQVRTGPGVEGAWPVEGGRLVPPVAAEGPLLEAARRGAKALMAQPEVLSVHLRGSALHGDANVQDIDLVAVLRGEATELIWAGCRQAVEAVEAPVPWDLRVVPLDSVHRGRCGPWLQLVLAAGSVRLAGDPLWEQAPMAVPGPVLAERLMAEWEAEWTRGLEQPGSDARTEWLQKRALRFGSGLGLAATGQLTRHPSGAVALVERVVPALGTAAAAVRDDLFAGDRSDAAEQRARGLGEALRVRWSGE